VFSSECVPMTPQRRAMPPPADTRFCEKGSGGGLEGGEERERERSMAASVGGLDRSENMLVRGGVGTQVWQRQYEAVSFTL
jgi:hypothetical protein